MDGVILKTPFPECLTLALGEASVGGYPKIRMSSPNTRERNANTFKDMDNARGDKESPKDSSSLKSCESPLHVPSRPLFIGRQRDFYIPKVPSNLRNIPNVNTYMNVFHFLYIYKSATSSHTKPGLLRRRL
jgi:hypothetical protein